MSVGVLRAVGVSVFVSLLRGQVNPKLDAFDAGFFGATDVQVIAFERQLLELMFQVVWSRPEVEQGAEEHVATDAAEDVQIQGLAHDALLSISALIWPAAKPAPKPLSI